jgi:site-specific DNA recombinase
MTPAHVTHGNKRYRYYTCSAAQKKGWHTCPSKSVPAARLERYVLEQVAPYARDVDWATRTPGERAERLRQFVARIDYDGTNQQVAITLHPNSPEKAKAS